MRSAAFAVLQKAQQTAGKAGLDAIEFCEPLVVGSGAGTLRRRLRAPRGRNRCIGATQDPTQPIPFVDDRRASPRVDQSSLSNKPMPPSEIARPAGCHEIMRVIISAPGMGQQVINRRREREESRVQILRLAAPADDVRKRPRQNIPRFREDHAGAAEPATPTISRADRRLRRGAGHSRLHLAGDSWPTNTTEPMNGEVFRPHDAGCKSVHHRHVSLAQAIACTRTIACQ